MIEPMIAQLRFVATYMEPSAYPSLLGGLGVVTSLVMPPPGSEWPFAANVLMWVGILTMLASFTLVMKKLLGRAPSLNEILTGLVTCASLEDYKKEQHLRHRGLEEQISALRHDTDARQNSDLVRTEKTLAEIFVRLGERERTFGEMRDQISRLAERTETHIRKLDQYDTKLDNLLKDVGRLASRSRNS